MLNRAITIENIGLFPSSPLTKSHHRSFRVGFSEMYFILLFTLNALNKLRKVEIIPKKNIMGKKLGY